MKTCLLRAGWAASILVIADPGVLQGAVPHVASSPQTSFACGTELLSAGTTRSDFVDRVGEPDEWFSKEGRVYGNRQTNRPPLTRGLKTLPVEFEQDHVSRLRIVPGTAVRDFLAKRNRPLLAAAPASAKQETARSLAVPGGAAAKR